MKPKDKSSPKTDALAGTVYVLDTSSLIEVRRLVPETSRPAVLGALSVLVDDGEMVFPSQVTDELKRFKNPSKSDAIFEWSKRCRAKAGKLGPCLPELRNVLNHPQAKRVLDPDKGGVEEADPYVLAQALALKSGGRQPVVVSQETRDRPDKLSIATACGVLRIVRIPIAALLEERGIWKR